MVGLNEMESFTKVKLNDEQLDILVKAVFGSETAVNLSSELTGGFFNTAYDLELSTGKSVILKVAPAVETDTLSYEKNIMRTEVEALRMVADKGVVPVPAVYHYDESLLLIPIPYFFMEKVEGLPYSDVKESLSLPERDAIETELGRYNRIINEIRGERFCIFGTDSEEPRASWRETFSCLMESVLADAKRLNAQLPASSEEIMKEVSKYLPALDAVTEPRLVHWDLWNGNVFVKDGVIVSLIDWERALWGDVLMEYYFRHFENSAGFYKGYGTTYDSPNEIQRKKLYDLYLDLILTIECYSRKYADEGYVRWTHDNLTEGWNRFKGSSE